MYIHIFTYIYFCMNEFVYYIISDDGGYFVKRCARHAHADPDALTSK